jgi:phosphatidylserine/phosphatidylglycerophosphate/cardiolipin synthase-like enzyme
VANLEMVNKWSKLFPKATINSVKYLIDGSETFKAIVGAIVSANTEGDYIYISGWMLDIEFPLIQGDRNTTLLKLLENVSKKSQNKVEIRVLIWDTFILDYRKMNSKNIPKLNNLETTKAFVDNYTYTSESTKKEISKLVPTLSDLIKKLSPYISSSYVREEVEDYARKKFKKDIDILEILEETFAVMNSKNVGSHHEKIIIVKNSSGLVAFCGGIDINENRFDSLHDTHLRIQGPEAHQILNKFIKRWNNHSLAQQHRLTGENDKIPIILNPTVGEDTLYTQVVGTYNSQNGQDKDRSLKESYLKIIDNAVSNIYIEDQYLVNLDVAKSLNKKIREPFFHSLIIVIQDSRETDDIFIPNKKRSEFINVLNQDLSLAQKNKIFLLMIDKDRANSSHFHSSMHAKTLIVDDEIAIIGSGNVTQRSFTHDSETSAVIFNIESTNKNNFAYKLREETWKEFCNSFSRKRVVISWDNFPRFIYENERNTFLSNYIESIDDLDTRIADFLKQISVPNTIAIAYLYKDDLPKALATASVINNPIVIQNIFELIWQNVIDPTAK